MRIPDGTRLYIAPQHSASLNQLMAMLAGKVFCTAQADVMVPAHDAAAAALFDALCTVISDNACRQPKSYNNCEKTDLKAYRLSRQTMKHT